MNDSKEMQLESIMSELMINEVWPEYTLLGTHAGRSISFIVHSQWEFLRVL